MEKEIIIFDTDMDTDCDDVGALVMLLKYHKKGLIDLKGIVVDCPCVGGAPVCQILCDYYNVDVPIGAIYERQYMDDRYDRYRKHRFTLPDEIYYNRTMLNMIDKRDEDFEPSYKVYRKVLSQCEDKSVTILGVGFYTAIEELFNSKADEYSELDGLTLFNNKVKRIVSMGKAETYTNNFNYNMDRIGAKVFMDKSECPIYFSPEGTEVITGYDFADKLSENNPLRIAYEIYNGGPNKGRMSWDLIAAYYAIGIDDSIFNIYSNGQVTYDTDENHTYWIKQSIRKDYEITLNISYQEMAERLEKILTE